MASLSSSPSAIIDSIQADINDVKEKIKGYEVQLNEAMKANEKEDIRYYRDMIAKSTERLTGLEQRLLEQERRQNAQAETIRDMSTTIDMENEVKLQSQLIDIHEEVDAIFLQNGVCFQYKESFSELFVRECYKKLFGAILEYCETDSQGIIVTGNPGIGKSYFLYYCLFRFLKLGKTVVFESAQQNISVLYRSHEKPLVFEGKAHEKFSEELRNPSTIYLFDPNKNAPVSVRAFTIIASSPRLETFKEFFKTKGVYKLYMPVWSLEEVGQMPSSITNEQKMEMFDKYGGIPRYIENDEKWGSILSQKIDGCDVKKVIDSVGNLENCSESHMLLQYVVNDKFQSESVQFASNFIFELLIKKWEANAKML